MKCRPLHDRVLIEPIKEDVTSGGIVIPDNAKEKPSRGKVVAIGHGAIQDNGSIRKLDVKVGDKVLYGKYAGSDIKLDGGDYVIMREDDILAVVE